MKIIYMDNNATTRVNPKVVEEMIPFYSKFYGNPSSMYSFAGVVGNQLEEARAKVAALISVQPEEIIFTSCGTESDSTAIYSALNSNPEKKHIVTTRVEHPAIKNLFENLAKKGYRVTFVPVDKMGRLDLDKLYTSLDDDTAVVSIMWANNESGVIFPIEEIAPFVKNRGIVFHTDAVQAVGKIPLDVRKVGVDMLSVSGHKLHAPKGVGALYVRKGTMFSPFLIGGHQERGRRGGTENVASIIGFGKAAELAAEHIDQMQTHVSPLRNKLESGLLKKVSHARVNGDPETRLPNTTNIGFDYVEGEAILLMLNELGICASSGSACTSGSLEPSHVLRAMGVPFTSAHGSIRFSLSLYNTEAEIDYVIEKVPPIIKRLREISPFWADKESLEKGFCSVQ